MKTANLFGEHLYLGEVSFIVKYSGDLTEDIIIENVLSFTAVTMTDLYAVDIASKIPGMIPNMFLPRYIKSVYVCFLHVK